MPPKMDPKTNGRRTRAPRERNRERTSPADSTPRVPATARPVERAPPPPTTPTPAGDRRGSATARTPRTNRADADAATQSGVKTGSALVRAVLAAGTDVVQPSSQEAPPSRPPSRPPRPSQPRTPYPLTSTEKAREDGRAQASQAIAETRRHLGRMLDPADASPIVPPRTRRTVSPEVPLPEDAVARSDPPAFTPLPQVLAKEAAATEVDEFGLPPPPPDSDDDG
eukprot:Opistho-1_new@77508